MSSLIKERNKFQNFEYYPVNIFDQWNGFKS
jgi:hypothetical protein